jgi:putative membrane-bound dehydrogenase-like protein
VEFIDYAVQTYGGRVKFLNFREALDRLEKNATAGVPLREPGKDGDNGVRILDVDNDGFMDVVIGARDTQITRVWRPKEQRWQETKTPTFFSLDAKVGGKSDLGVKFGVLRPDGAASILVKSHFTGAWSWNGKEWETDPSLLAGLPDGEFNTGKLGRDAGVRLHDFDGDGRCELLVSNEQSNAIFEWNAADKAWKRADYALPGDVTIADSEARDGGLRLVDLNGDGFDDVIFSNDYGYSIHLWAGKVRNDLGWKKGWPHKVASGKAGEIPSFVRNGQNNGAWFHHDHLVVQNEDTMKLEANTWIRSFKELIAFPVPPPKSPEESLKCLVPRPGFTVELVAGEPLIQSPVAFEWDAQGRLWVVEMRDYPLGMDGKGQPGGVVKVLTDTDGDGVYDHAAIFAKGLAFPTGIFPCHHGVLVAAAPEIRFFELNDDPEKPEVPVVNRLMFTGFKPGNQQHRMNGFDWGLDGWLYGANGDSGGAIRMEEVKDAPAANISGRDFRFLPSGTAFEAESGATQYGRHRDDWGNWFGNNNPTWLWHYTVEDRYLRRNPKLAVKSVRQILANYADSTRVFTAYPLETAPTRMNQPQSLGHVTSANSPTPYRDELFGPDFATSVFISEPVHNAVHREVLVPDGATFTSHRAEDERDREFLASTDQWFRPTMLKTGPDGALYVADMYRFVLEHPEWIAPETQSRLDLRAGADKGRIYRVFPAGKKPRAIPNLNQLDNARLAAAMDSPSGWQRDTVQRLLLERTAKETAPALRALAATAKEPKARLQSVATLATLGALELNDVRLGVRDVHPQVRVQALRASEALAAQSPASRPALLEVVLACERDPELVVRRQLAFTLGEFRRKNTPAAVAADVVAALARLAEREGSNAQMRVAILSSLQAEDALFAKLDRAPAANAPATALPNLPPASPDRVKVIAGYAKVGTLKGDATRGHELFKTQCALCHRLKGDGIEVGPDLAMVADKPTDWLLTAMLDPNAAIEPRYQAQLLTLKNGTALTGLITGETANNVTLRLPGGTEQAVLRSDIASEKPLGKSLMPEGLEAALDAQGVADVLAWLRAK